MNYEYSSMIDLDKIAINLYYFRVINNFTTKQVAKCLNLCPSQYEMFEKGDVCINLFMLDILRQLYIVSIQDLLYPDTNKFNENILKAYKKSKKLNMV